MRPMPARMSVLVLLAAAALAGCGSQSAPGGSSSPVSSQSSSTPSTPPSTSSSGRDVTLRGTVSGDRLPCVRFVSDDGRQLVITGAVPGTLLKVARSGSSRTSLSAQPSPAQTATVTIVGHTQEGLMNPCGGTTFVVTSATVHSITRS